MNSKILRTPIVLLVVLLITAFLSYLHFFLLSNLLAVIAIIFGSRVLVQNTWESIRHKNFALDYIAILAILTGVFSGHLVVALVIVLMMSGGSALEIYAKSKASSSLKMLIERLPKTVEIITNNKQFSVDIDAVSVGSTVLVRRGEVIPLDGILQSAKGLVDESSLTGESIPNIKQKGNLVKSGTVNVGNVLTLKTTVNSLNSTYSQIVKLVQNSQSSKSPLTRLADSLSGWFTLLTLALCAVAYYLSGDIGRVLAVLVIATPCPLILAAPIAFIGGINSAAKKRIIVKNIAAIESLAKVKAMVFDKTGTLTFGYPELSNIDMLSSRFTKKELLKIAAGLEINSLHPYAQSIVSESKKQRVLPAKVANVSEEIGRGISGTYKGSTFSLTKSYTDSTQIILLQNTKKIAAFTFVDKIKNKTINALKSFSDQKIKLHIFTGDTKEKTKQITDLFSFPVEVHTDCTPKSKQLGIKEIKKKYSVAMVGDGINDAPALALADVGIAFSHNQQTASTEAADIVLVSSNFDQVLEATQIAKNTLCIAKQSMYVGVFLSLIGMLFAVQGHITPLSGSLIQELIDVAVILNAIRTSKVLA